MTVVSEQEHEAELPERCSAKAKTDVVLRLLRGGRFSQLRPRRRTGARNHHLLPESPGCGP